MCRSLTKLLNYYYLLYSQNSELSVCNQHDHSTQEYDQKIPSESGWETSELAAIPAPARTQGLRYEKWPESFQFSLIREISPEPGKATIAPARTQGLRQENWPESFQFSSVGEISPESDNKQGKLGEISTRVNECLDNLPQMVENKMIPAEISQSNTDDNMTMNE